MSIPWSYRHIKIGLFEKLGASTLIWIIICIGIFLRITQYIANKSLWYDESQLALNIIDRSFLELLKPLEPFQVAPLGFLMIEKLAIMGLGNTEYALRLFPLVCGIISIFLFYGVAKYFVRRNAVPIALGFFAISGPLIYYSSELKQYSIDVAIVLLLYMATIYIKSKELTLERVVLYGIIGVIAIWFSHTSIFVLAGIGTALTLFCIIKKEWSTIGKLIIAYSLWALSFLIYYSISLNMLSNNEYLLRFWDPMFMPFPPSSLSDVKWFASRFLDFGYFIWIFRWDISFIPRYDPLWLSLSAIMLLPFLIGCILFLKNKQEWFYLLIFPVFFTLLASGFHKYPFHGRLLLFIVPIVLLIIAEGIDWIRDKTSNKSLIIGIVLIGLLFFSPLVSASYHIIYPRTRVEIKPVMSYVKENWQPRDMLYLYYTSEYAFKYYSLSYGFTQDDYVVGISSDDWEDYKNDLDKLQGKKRVWILFSFHAQRLYIEEKSFLRYLDSIGSRIDSFKAPGATVYLYDLSE